MLVVFTSSSFRSWANLILRSQAWSRGSFRNDGNKESRNILSSSISSESSCPPAIFLSRSTLVSSKENHPGSVLRAVTLFFLAIPPNFCCDSWSRKDGVWLEGVEIDGDGEGQGITLDGPASGDKGDNRGVLSVDAESVDSCVSCGTPCRAAAAAVVLPDDFRPIISSLKKKKRLKYFHRLVYSSLASPGSPDLPAGAVFSSLRN